MSEIQPAMTPQEWDAVLNCGETPERIATRYEHAIAAYRLHDQPFGFTWADVDALREAATAIEGEWGAVDWGTAELRHPLRSLADRIAALLPPAPRQP